MQWKVEETIVYGRCFNKYELTELTIIIQTKVKENVNFTHICEYYHKICEKLEMFEQLPMYDFYHKIRFITW